MYDLNFHSAISGFSANASAAWAHMEPQGQYASIFTLGATQRLGERTTVNGSVIYAPSNATESKSTIWLYRARLDHSITPTLSLGFVYQLTDYHSTAIDASYVDNLFMLVLTKRL